MAWSPAHKIESRERILASAAQLFTRHGFDKVGINDIMAHADMTRGAFYAHFKSKSALYAEAIVAAAHQSRSILLNELPEHATQSQVLTAYLSNAHREGNSACCPLAFLTTDISQRDPAVRAAYTRVFRGFLGELEQLTEARKKALQSAVLMIGGLAIARALDDPALVDELFSACRQAAE